MNHILIYGAPGAGKTTASKLVHKDRHIPLYEGDYLREVIAASKETEQENPFLYVGTKQAWRKFGGLTTENVVKGLLAVRDSMRSYVDAELAKHESIIFEAAFIDPTHYPSVSLSLVVTLDEAKHCKQFFTHRPETQDMLEGFQATRMVQDYLVDEAQRLGVTLVHNDDDSGHLLKQFEAIPFRS